MLIELFHVVAAICIFSSVVSLVIYLVTKEPIAGVFVWLYLAALVVYTFATLVLLR